MESVVRDENTAASQLPLVVYVDESAERRQAAEFALDAIDAQIEAIGRFAEAEALLKCQRDGVAVVMVSYPITDGGLVTELECLRGRYPTVQIIVAFPPGVGHLMGTIFRQLAFGQIGHDDMFAEGGARLRKMVVSGLEEAARRRVHGLLGRHAVQILAHANRLWEKRVRGYTDRMLALWDLLAPHVDISLVDREMMRVAIALYSIPDRYTTMERSEDGRNRRFSAIAGGMLAGLDGLGSVREALADLYEAWDGQGVPAGKQGDQISLLARLMAAIDAFDEWVELDHLAVQSAGERLKREAGVLFDPQVVTAFGQMMRDHLPEVEDLYRVR